MIEAPGGGGIDGGAHARAAQDAVVSVGERHLDAERAPLPRLRPETLDAAVVRHDDRDRVVGDGASSERGRQQRGAIERLSEPASERVEVHLVSDDPVPGGAVDEAARRPGDDAVHDREAPGAGGIDRGEPAGEPSRRLVVECGAAHAKAACLGVPREDAPREPDRALQHFVPRGQGRAQVGAESARPRGFALQARDQCGVAVVADLRRGAPDHLSGGEGGVVAQDAFRRAPVVAGSAMGLEGEERRGEQAGKDRRDHEGGPSAFAPGEASHVEGEDNTAAAARCRFRAS